MKKCPGCGAEVEESTRTCPYCGTEFAGSAGSTPAMPNAQAQATQPEVVSLYQFGMKWFKFLIYFALFASAVLNFFSAISFFTGATYGDPEVIEAIYETYPALKAVDITVGVLTLGLAGLAIFTRFQLAAFKKNAPILLYVMYGLDLAISLLYVLVASVATGLNLFSGNTAVSILTSVVMIACNVVYFKKRACLFTE